MEIPDGVISMMAILIPILSSAIGYFVREIREEQKSENVVQEALKELLRESMERQVDKWKPLGYIRRIDKNKFISTRNVYERLVGSNGYVDELEFEINALEVRE